jgi:hypothetical protein
MVFERAASLEGVDFIESPQLIIDRLLYQHEMFGHQHLLASPSMAPLASRALSAYIIATTFPRRNG